MTYRPYKKPSDCGGNGIKMEAIREVLRLLYNLKVSPWRGLSISTFSDKLMIHEMKSHRDPMFTGYGEEFPDDQ